MFCYAYMLLCIIKLFEFIFFFSRVWVSNKIAKTFTHNVAMSYRQAFSLRQRMLDCIQHLAYYMMVEVIEPNWLTFISKMSKVRFSNFYFNKFKFY